MILPVLSVDERSESKHFPLEMEVDVCDYNVTDGSAICKIESKTYEKIIWDAKNFKSVIMTETYLRVLEQKYARDVYCRFRLGISDWLVHKNTEIQRGG